MICTRAGCGLEHGLAVLKAHWEISILLVVLLLLVVRISLVEQFMQ